MLARMSSRELTEWQAYFRIENEEMEEQRLSSQARAGAKTRMGR